LNKFFERSFNQIREVFIGNIFGTSENGLIPQVGKYSVNPLSSNNHHLVFVEPLSAIGFTRKKNRQVSSDADLN
jgi:hypothetical protein